MNHLRGMLRQEGIKLQVKAFNDGSIFELVRENRGIITFMSGIQIG